MKVPKAGRQGMYKNRAQQIAEPYSCALAWLSVELRHHSPLSKGVELTAGVRAG